MNRFLRSIARLAVGPMLLAACTAQEAVPGPESSAPVPVAIRLTLSGDTAPVLNEDGTGQLELARDGASAPVTFVFNDDALAVHDLAPGRYKVAALGPLQCRGLAFEVGAAPRYLGAVQAKLVEAKADVALMSRASVPPQDVAELAERAGTAPDGVDARPLEIPEAAPCFLGPDGPATTWEDLPLGDKIILSVSLAGVCAVALVAGGFCMF